MKKILLIDENVLDYKNDIDVLESEYKVEAVGFIDTARYLLKRNKYDLIVLDIMMPTLGLFDSHLEETADGLKTGLVYYEYELKQLDTPVLFWSWNTDFKEESKEKEWINCSFLLKDIDERCLIDGVNDFLRELKR
jgi:PleD family two-component response regulator